MQSFAVFSLTRAMRAHELKHRRVVLGTQETSYDMSACKMDIRGLARALVLHER